MTYIPTKEELDSLDFNHEYDDYHEELQAWHTKCPIDININIKDDWDIECYLDNDKDLQFYPRSIWDLEILIKMFTPE